MARCVAARAKRTAKFIRTARGTMVLNDSDAKIVKKYMPYDR